MITHAMEQGGWVERDQRSRGIAGSGAWLLRAKLEVSYPVVESRGLFSLTNTALLEHVRSAQALVVVDHNVDRLYGQRIRDYFRHHRVEHRCVVLKSTETEKNFHNVQILSRAMHDFGLNRRGDPVIAIGGGVLLDIVGLAASLYRRGVSYLRVPTSLIGLVDAGVGVKTAINLDQHKNRLGTYCPPTAVYLDRDFLGTLDQRHMSNGFAEILKIALIRDYRLFELLESHADGLLEGSLQQHSHDDEVFHRAVGGMLEELAPNLWESVLERRVDYGHSFSPTIEMAAQPDMLHGEAVCIDMVFSLLLAQNRRLVSADDVARALRIIHRLRLPLLHQVVTPKLLASALGDTVRHRDGKQRLPLTAGLGDCVFVNDVTAEEIEQVFLRQQTLALSFSTPPQRSCG